MLKIILFPIKVVLIVLGWLVDLFIKAECFIVGIGGLFLLACLIYSIANQVWGNVILLVGMIIVGIVFVLLTAEIKLGIEILLEKLP